MSQFVVTSAKAFAGAGFGKAIASGVANAAASVATTGLENILFGPVKRKNTGPRIESFQIQASTEGAGIPMVFGKMRLAGQVIWASKFFEKTTTSTSRQGGKASRSVQTDTTEFVYSISLAIGLSEGQIDRIGQVWADGRLIKLSDYEVRFYQGSEDQLPDPLIEQIEGFAPSYRGLSYIVFEDLPLAEFGNRIPQFHFEIERRLPNENNDQLEEMVRAITLIPGSGEFTYGTTSVQRQPEEGVFLPENQHNFEGKSDLEVSLDHLQMNFPQLKSVSLIVSWFGTDLRAGHCDILPGVERREKETTPYEWEVFNLNRDQAHLVSTRNGAPAYGGTPSDRSVIEAIREIKSRGLKVTFYPFVLMDITIEQNLPAPEGGIQGAYPWRGRIAASGDVNDAETFFTKANGYNAMITHYAALCEEAGGVDSFLIGSELRGLTTSTNGDGVYPAVQALKNLAQDVRAILRPLTTISYAADWSEYVAHQANNGSGDVYFHLDDLWADPAIDYVGIDNYLPLSDWREGGSNIDAENFDSVYDFDYLQNNIQGGEYYDWYYINEEARATQERTEISDTSYGEPWVFRAKDFWHWWSSAHHNRPSGERLQTSTAWLPQMKPIKFTELGCGAVHLGANQPNKFSDPKSAENGAPYFSDGSPDDLMQRRFLEAHLSFWTDHNNNPISSTYNKPMIDTDDLAVYTWDARPWPYFPSRDDIWSDGANWETGHWLNGRVGKVSLSSLIQYMGEQAEGVSIDVAGISGLVAGYVVSQPMSIRDMLEPLTGIYQLDCVEIDGGLRFSPKYGEAQLTLSGEKIVEGVDGRFERRLAQSSELPSSVDLVYVEEGGEYAVSVAEAKRYPNEGEDEIRAQRISFDAPLSMGENEASIRAQNLLADALVMAEDIKLRLPPSAIALEAGDVFRFEETNWRIVDILDGEDREILASRTAPGLYDTFVNSTVPAKAKTPIAYGPPVFEILDLPLLYGGNEQDQIFIAAHADPWPGRLSVFAGQGDSSQSITTINSPSIMGRLLGPLQESVSNRWDYHSKLHVRFNAGAAASAERVDVLNGANMLAVQSMDGTFEVCQFQHAEMQEDGSWILFNLLRGQRSGTDFVSGAAAGARVVVLATATPVAFQSAWQDIPLTWSIGPASEAVGTENYAVAEITAARNALKPPAPCHVKVTKGGGNIDLSWIRRSRLEGGWGGADTPLGELYERYQVTVQQGDFEKTWQVDQPNWTYSAAEQTDDGLTDSPIGAGITVSIQQISDIVGPGFAAMVEI